jgi:F420-non-reducing hydrogenase iron-sulfur subunit
MMDKKTDNWEPRIAAFICSWCSSLAADLAGSSGLQYSPSVRLVKVPCSGRVNPLHVVHALKEGYDGVLITGCHPGDCHYVNGNRIAQRKFAVMRNYLEFLGVEAGRVGLLWVSGSEGTHFAASVEAFAARIEELGPADKLAKQCVS